MVYIRKHSALLAVTVLLAYFFIAQTSIQNKHTHFYPNGVVITHSHPVNHNNNEPIQNHGHTKTEICFFNNVHFDFYNIAEPPSCFAHVNERPVVFHISDSRFVYSVFFIKSDPRGPPSVDVIA